MQIPFSNRERFWKEKKKKKRVPGGERALGFDSLSVEEVDAFFLAVGLEERFFKGLGFVTPAVLLGLGLGLGLGLDLGRDEAPFLGIVDAVESQRWRCSLATLSLSPPPPLLTVQSSLNRYGHWLSRGPSPLLVYNQRHAREREREGGRIRRL